MQLLLLSTTLLLNTRSKPNLYHFDGVVHTGNRKLFIYLFMQLNLEIQFDSCKLWVSILLQILRLRYSSSHVKVQPHDRLAFTVGLMLIRVRVVPKFKLGLIYL